MPQYVPEAREALLAFHPKRSVAWTPGIVVGRSQLAPGDRIALAHDFVTARRFFFRDERGQVVRAWVVRGDLGWRLAYVAESQTLDAIWEARCQPQGPARRETAHVH
jgi:hypothetical protein